MATAIRRNTSENKAVRQRPLFAANVPEEPYQQFQTVPL